MSKAVVSLPEKRPNSGYDNMPEQTPEKRVKSAMKLQSRLCMICGCYTDHSSRECPNYSQGMGMACYKCFEPCEIKEHEDKLKLILKFCVCCSARGKHWSKDCPSPIYDDDMYF